MPKVRVWNDNIYPYNEKFRDQDIMIPAKEFIVMERDQAVLFRGTMNAVKLDSNGQANDARYFKKIRLEPISGNEADEITSSPKFRCEMDGRVFDTEGQLKKHIDENYKDRIVVDEEAEREMAQRKRQKKAG